MTLFECKYKTIKNLTVTELETIEERMLAAINICEPLNTHIRNFLIAPSKRIRPVLAILCKKTLGYDLSDRDLEILTAIELVHNASLIHDDIIDDSKLRRGSKTINAEFGSKLGVVSGDYLLAIAMEKIAGVNDVKVLTKFSQTLRQMCIGEINQNFSRFKIQTIEEYIEKSKNKTGYLFECALETIASKPSPEFGDFGLNFGIAFQIRDDLMNVLQADDTKPATDIIEGVYTAPVIFAGSVENVTQGIEKTRALLNNYLDRAKQCLEKFEDNIYTQALYQLLELMKYE